MKLNNIYITLILLFGYLSVYGQQTSVSGKITDAETGEGMPFVNVFFQNNTTTGTTTDFEGYFKLKGDGKYDSIVARYIGYITKIKAVKPGDQVINFQLQPQITEIEEIVIRPGENRAWPIMRKVIENKDKHDKRKLDAYQYESYAKTEIVIDNISENFRKKKAFAKIAQLFDSVKTIAGEDGKPVLPFFISESVSNFYYRKNPELKTEKIMASKITGVGMDDGSLISQLIGSSFQEYNFYKNWLNIVEKEFVSPISNGWKSSYDYLLLDSVNINGYKCYKIEVEPKRKQDLAFTGTIWITADSFALKQIDVAVGRSANLNFIEKIRVQQELEPTTAGSWIPIKSRILIDIDEIGANTPGVIAKFYVSNKNVVVNAPLEVKSYEQLIEVDENALDKKDEFWAQNRHDSLTNAEINMYKMVDSIRNLPMIKNYVELINIVVNGYKRVGIIDIGPYLYTFNYNSVEGSRFRLGFVTNIDFSKKWVFRTHLAYGTKDKVFKYGVKLNYIFSKKRWSEAGVEYKYDINQAGLIDNFVDGNSLFFNFANNGTLKRPFMQTVQSAFFSREVKKGWIQKVQVKNEEFHPLYSFAYLENNNTQKTDFSTFEIMSETRWAKNELFLVNENERISLGTGNYPIITLTAIKGFKGVLNSNFNYGKLKINATQDIKLGKLGYGTYSLTAGKIFGTVPYPLLKIHLGNQTLFYNSFAFNLMNYFEFVSDQYASLKYDHYFEGLLTNRIPLIRRLKWRVLAGTNILYGTASAANFNLIPTYDNFGNTVPKFTTLQHGKPYIELNYGVENIFKFLRVDFMHRLTYFNAPGANKFGIKFTAQFKL